MKKAVIILLIIMIISFTIAGILIGIQLQNMETLERKTITVENTKEIELSDKLREISIKSIFVDNINILSTSEDKIKVNISGSYSTIVDRKIDIYVHNKGKKLEIEIDQEGWFKYIQFGDYKNDLTLDIYIPETYNKEVEIKGMCKNLNIEKEVLEHINIKEKMLDLEEKKFYKHDEFDL